MADLVIEALRHAPVLSAAAWFSLAVLHVSRDRWHTWMETFFLFSCFFAGVYAFGAWMFLNAEFMNPVAARFALQVSLTGLALALHFFLLFSLVYVDRMKPKYWAFTAVTVAIAVLIWSGVVSDVLPPSRTGTLYVPLYHSIPFAIMFAYFAAFATAGIWNLYRLYRIARRGSKALARRAAGLVLTFSVALVLGLVTDGYNGITQNPQAPPLFPTLLIFVAGMAYYTLFPVSGERISEAIRRFHARRYNIRAAFLTYQDGTLIGSKIRRGEDVVDEDLFGATLDVIQNFMRTSFPILRGSSLRSISHGNYTLIMESTRHVYLTVVLEGQESDHLRRQMRDGLLKFEGDNRRVLAEWRGMAVEARGAEDLIRAFFIEEPLSEPHP